MMEKQPLFIVDNKGYDVHVLKLTRKFSVLDTDKSGRTLDGQMYREPLGTFYNYTLTVSPRVGKESEMDALWEAISQPASSHVCVFPYGQKMLTQKMYITTGEQALVRRADGKNHWGELTINFIAMGPKVRA